VQPGCQYALITEASGDACAIACSVNAFKILGPREEAKTTTVISGIVEHFGQTGSLADLYRHYGIDANAIVTAAQAIAPGRPIRHLKTLLLPSVSRV
jgi:pyruvate dehydrogenase complex dehydrogenase (E1) component